MKKKFAFLSFLMCLSLIFTGCSWLKNNQSLEFTSPLQIVKTQTDITETITPTDIVNSNIEAVVTIFVTSSSGEQISFGSGVAVHSGGYIATNYHVISLAISSPFYSLEVYHNNSKVSHNAEILWSNINLDVAIIKCSCGDMPFVEMVDRFVYASQNNKLQPLEEVVAIGTPVDLSLQNTATFGYVSSSSGRISYADTGVVYETLIQHTAPINHGNSGGPLFDMTGKLIGLNTLGNDDANSLFFAVPIYPVIKVIDKVVLAYENNTNYAMPVLGVSAIDRYMAQNSGESFSSSGLLINDITNGTNAVGKLIKNDVIKGITINNIFYNIDVRNDLLFALLNANSKDVVSVKLTRGIIDKTIDISLL